MIYAGIGSRNTPAVIMREMVSLAHEYAAKGYILRSGGASGADSAFELGSDKANGTKEIYLPWQSYNDNSSLLYDCYPIEYYSVANRVYGDRWSQLSNGARLLMIRNVAQIIGIVDYPDTSDFVLCWTPDGCDSISTRTRYSGGTGNAIALANELDIPVFNMYNDNYKQQLEQYMFQRKLFE